MTARMVLTGDVNLMNVTDPAVPFSLVADEFHAADIVFCNLECCLCQPPSGHSVEHEGFLADPVEAAIMASIARLDELGIAHTGAGANRAHARDPPTLPQDGVRFGFLQRSA